MVTMNHEYSKGGMIGLAVVFMILPIIFFALRLWAKSLTRHFAVDDYLTGGALASTAPLCCTHMSTNSI